VAQWNGQYTGNTHGTKVIDTERSLKLAIEAYKASPEALKLNKRKAVGKLAEKLLNARLKFVTAKLSEVASVEAENWEARRTRIEHLQEQESKLILAGVPGILQEFEVEDS
jgi:hypothetical protein